MGADDTLRVDASWWHWPTTAVVLAYASANADSISPASGSCWARITPIGQPAVMQGFAASLDGAAEHLAVQLAELDAQVGQMLGGWRGASGSAYGSAWELWHRGAGEVQLGLSMLAAAIAHAGAGYQHNETASAQVLREVGGG